MNRLFKRNFNYLIVITAFLFSTSAYSGNRCVEIFQPLIEKIQESSLVSLHNRHQMSGDVFINQKHERALPDKGGACGPTCAVNMLQGLRHSIGVNLVKDPYMLIEDLYKAQPILKQGGISPQSMHEALEYLISSGLGTERRIVVESRVLDFLDQRRHSWANVRLVNEISPIKLNPNEFKILFFGIITPNGKRIDTHSILVKNSTVDYLEVIEPNRPEESMGFHFERVKINESFNSFELKPDEHNIFTKYPQGIRFIVLAEFSARIAN